MHDLFPVRQALGNNLYRTIQTQTLVAPEVIKFAP